MAERCGFCVKAARLLPIASKPITVKNHISPTIQSDSSRMSTKTASIAEVYHLLRQIDKSKATNSIDFPSWISKNNAESLCIPLAHIINAALAEDTFPTLWKYAEICPQPKNLHLRGIANTAPYLFYGTVASCWNILSLKLCEIHQSSLISMPILREEAVLMRSSTLSLTLYSP